jgi:hypothetical protein
MLEGKVIQLVTTEKVPFMSNSRRRPASFEASRSRYYSIVGGTRYPNALHVTHMALIEEFMGSDADV